MEDGQGVSRALILGSPLRVRQCPREELPDFIGELTLYMLSSIPVMFDSYALYGKYVWHLESFGVGNDFSYQSISVLQSTYCLCCCSHGELYRQGNLVDPTAIELFLSSFLLIMDTCNSMTLALCQYSLKKMCKSGQIVFVGSILKQFFQLHTGGKTWQTGMLNCPASFHVPYCRQMVLNNWSIMQLAPIQFLLGKLKEKDLDTFRKTSGTRGCRYF